MDTYQVDFNNTHIEFSIVEGEIRRSGYDLKSEILAAHLTGGYSVELMFVLALQVFLNRGREGFDKDFGRMCAELPVPSEQANFRHEIVPMSQLHVFFQASRGYLGALMQIEDRDLLLILSKSEDPIVRHGVASNGSLTQDILNTLAHDSELEVVKTVARRTSNSDLLDDLAKNPSLLPSIVANPHAGDSLLEKYVNASLEVKQSMAMNVRSQKLIEILSNDPDYQVRKALGLNYSLDESIRIKLARDEDAAVRHIARLIMSKAEQRAIGKYDLIKKEQEEKFRQETSQL